MELQELIDQQARERFGLQSLRPYQRLVIQRILEQDHKTTEHEGMLVVLPTGSGKSVCFMLPSLLVKGLTVIVYPLLSLMNDQVKRFSQSNIACVCIRGGQTKEQRRAIWEQLEGNKARVVITNAECMLTPQVIANLSPYTISLLVVDEAHTVVQWGKSFRPSYAGLGSIIAYLTVRQLLAFTATADEAITKDLQAMLFLGKKPHMVRGSSDRENIIYHCQETISKAHSLSMLLNDQIHRPAVVFCATRKECEVSSSHFSTTNPSIPTRYYHAGLGMECRTALESWFSQTDEGVLFSTNAFGMGVDKKNIRTVIHRTLSRDVASFLQESGRAGRDGEQAHSYVLVGEEEYRKAMKERQKAEGTSPFLQLYTIFTKRDSCIRESLLLLLGERLEGCSGCDVCNQNLHDLPDGQKQIVSTVRCRPLAYTPGRLAKLLCQSDSHDSRSGVLTGWTEKELVEAIKTLLARNILAVSRYPRKRLYTRIVRKKALVKNNTLNALPHY
ncbi:RecQ family ATP-dependent DNA helicase [Sphaerochaeta sp. PS]|uniref:RecQ family ATP-dependent DNA helicase n=1 Tax=Sphaerochaeta sp. PS TaxID=3076336 RepID=UPI0028A3B7F3|nr:RecQ family ATP-dependent DNA helicase [Sphaerochaeta sp. PS]MDT4762767.1 RecQ family ATP-dependent DNA helicase [Sphaerochaeta sp. PS]